MNELPPPKNLKELQSALGLFQYYKNYVPNFARIAGPLYAALKKDRTWYWGPNQQQAFDTLKRMMQVTPILIHPDYNKPFILYTDASYSGLGYILCQLGNDNLEHPVQYGGRKLLPSENNYTITELECLGVVWGVRKNKQFLGQNPFTIYTDHKALETLKKQELPTIGRRTRWILELEIYNYQIIHRQSKKMDHVDHFSRQSNSGVIVHWSDYVVPDWI
jgi:hypothetical protein